MVTVAPAWDNERAAVLTGPFLANHEQRSESAWAEEPKRELDICQPALAATITRDAERLCSQQVKFGVLSRYCALRWFARNVDRCAFMLQTVNVVCTESRSAGRMSHSFVAI